MTADLPFDREWTNASAMQLEGVGDPLTKITAIVDDLLLCAADAGAIGSPTDPFQLAQLMGIALRPHFDVIDARLVTDPPSAKSAQPRVDVAPLSRFVTSGHGLAIEYNPTRPRGRLRFSVAHELAHAFFSDAADDTRHRSRTGAVEELSEDDSWQLELLCNVAAAEILMPTAAIQGVVNTKTDIDFLMAQRAKFHVSTEALLRRLIHATDRPIALAALSRQGDSIHGRLRCDYVLGARTWRGRIGRGTSLDIESLAALPAAVGQTARGNVTVDGEQWDVQSVGVPPYAGRALPRVLALLERPEAAQVKHGLRYVTGDIAEAIEEADVGASVVIGHVVSDAARAWGRYGVAGTLSRVMPDARSAFHAWSIADPNNLRLGNVHKVTVSTAGGVNVTVLSLVAQAGYGPSSKPRLSYVALAEALDKLADVAESSGGAVHIPRIGAGQGGGRWDLIEAAIERSILARGVPVVVHTLPARTSKLLSGRDA